MPFSSVLPIWESPIRYLDLLDTFFAPLPRVDRA